MPYAAVLSGEAHVLEAIAPCFAAEGAKIRKLDAEWILESSTFESCQSPTEAITAAEALLTRIHQVLALYLRLYDPFSILTVVTLDDSGVEIRRLLRAVIKVSVYSSAGVRLLSTPQGPIPLGNLVLSRATKDPVIAAALDLVSSGSMTWSQIYDIIEFLGGPPGISRVGLASVNDVRRFRRTANHFRHLGDPKNSPLPLNPPTLSDAIGFATELLKGWIALKP